MGLDLETAGKAMALLGGIAAVVLLLLLLFQVAGAGQETSDLLRIGPILPWAFGLTAVLLFVGVGLWALSRGRSRTLEEFDWYRPS